MATAPVRAQTRDVEQAVAAAADAARAWGATAPAIRARVLLESVRVLLDRADDIATTITGETGKPRTEALSHDLFPALDHAAWLARNAARILRPRRIRYTQPHLLQKRAWELHEPLGVVAVITPYNVPFGIPFTSVATAVAAGNAVVLKPSELTPACGDWARRVLEEAGAPPGLVSVVHGEAPAGEALVAHPDIAKVFFTGSVAAGRRVAAAAGARGCPVVLELGGKDAFVVFADADLERAVEGALFAAFTGAGQVCVSAERIYVERPVHDAFVGRLVARAEALRPHTDVGPLITERRRARVEALVAEAGGEVLTGGRAGDGAFFEPTVILGPTPGSAIEREEIFGPAVTVEPFDAEDEVVARANASEFALGASVWTRDLRRARRVAGRIHGGMVWVNDFGYSFGAAQTSWGGAKGSGFGRSLSTHGLRECVQVKLVDVDPGRFRPAWWFPYDERTETALRNGLHVLYGRGLGRARAAWRYRGRPAPPGEARARPLTTRVGERLQGGRLAARAIRAHGLDTIFTLSGGHVMPIYEGCRHEDVRVVDVRHEAAAGHAAEAYGRIRRACGVAVVTAGPGVTNVVTAVANCFAAQTPLVVIGGARPLGRAEAGALQEFDQLSLLKPITKWAAVCAAPDRIEEYVAIAFRQALAHPFGPVYLELPMDVLFADAAASDRGPVVERARAVPDPAAVERAAELLGGAERPVLLGGAAVWWDGAWDALRALAEQARLPVFLNGSGRGALPPEHELFFQHARRAALESADVVCVVGAPLDFRLGYGRFGDAKLIHAHGDERELGRNAVPAVALAGDARAALEGLRAHVVARERPAWFETLRAAEQAWWDGHRTQIESDAAPVHHYRLGAELARALDDDVVVIGDGGDVVAAVSRVLRVRRPGHWLDPGPFGCLGVGLPYALGVAAARPEARILVVSGDGALGLNGFELDTLARFGVPAVVVVGNDGAWGEIRVPQIGIYGDEGEIATRLAPSAYERLTDVFGGHAELVERPEEIGPALERAFAAGEPAVVNVLLDPDAMQGHAYRGM